MDGAPAPETAGELARLADELKAGGRLAEAIEAYRRAIGLAPGSFALCNNLGNALAEAGRLDEAEISYRRALELEPNAIEVLVNLADCLNDLDRPADALEMFRRARTAEPSHPYANHMAAALGGETAAAAPASYIRALYDGYADEFEDHLVNVLGYDGPRDLRVSLEAAPGFPGRFRRMLDLGCGTGLAGAAFAGIAEAIDGVDLSPGMLKRAEAKRVYASLHCAEAVGFLMGGASAATYDLILAADIFIYIGDLAPMFAGAAAGLVPGGYFAFSIELLDAGDYRLLPNGRFAHGADYIDRLATGAGFHLVARRDVVIREEQHVAVAGQAVVLQRGR